MPALSFGLKSSKVNSIVSKPNQKRKNLFGDEDEDAASDGKPDPRTEAVKDLGGFGEEGSPRPRKSPKLSPSLTSNGASQTQKYLNLSSLHSAKLQDAQASTLDSSVYDYDGVYDTFHAQKESSSTGNNGASGPKYMKSLIASADVRKRDLLRAKEKQLQREREAEGDEFADKEKFVTGAYKQQQEEVKRLEEEESRKQAEEEERRKKGGGMTGWHRELLRKDEERMKAIEKAAEDAKSGMIPSATLVEDQEDETGARTAAELNERGARIVVNDEGEVVDKRQLLSAGLNVARKPKAPVNEADTAAAASNDAGYHRSSTAQNARQSQRERQTRMLEQQLEEMTEKARQAEEDEQRQREEKARSAKTETDKMGAKERYLARKREREEEAKRAKNGEKTSG